MIDIDCLWVGVGDHEKTGDAIACQFTNPKTGTNVVMVIDGGYREDGTRLANHVRKYYGVGQVDLAGVHSPGQELSVVTTARLNVPQESLRLTTFPLPASAVFAGLARSSSSRCHSSCAYCSRREARTGCTLRKWCGPLHEGSRFRLQARGY
jgi:hypothetical protein